MALVIILLRFAQYASAAILFGIRFLPGESALYDEQRGTKSILLSAAAALVFAVPLGFLAQLVQLAGSLPAAMDTSAFHVALFDMNFGNSSLVRLILALLALAANVLMSAGRRLSLVCSGLGLLICGSFAWMGHGAASEGALGLVHLAADIIHILARSNMDRRTGRLRRCPQTPRTSTAYCSSTIRQNGQLARRAVGAHWTD